MKITTRHRGSKFGHPVILDDDGTWLEDGYGIQKAMEKLGIKRKEMAEKAGICVKTLDIYRNGSQRPSVDFLNVLRDMLEDAGL